MTIAERLPSTVEIIERLIFSRNLECTTSMPAIPSTQLPNANAQFRKADGA
jgi:hypothetical protein